jgi:hypothetical protein
MTKEIFFSKILEMVDDVLLKDCDLQYLQLLWRELFFLNKELQYISQLFLTYRAKDFTDGCLSVGQLTPILHDDEVTACSVKYLTSMNVVWSEIIFLNLEHVLDPVPFLIRPFINYLTSKLYHY